MLRFTTARVPLRVTAVKMACPLESRSNSQTRWFQVLGAGREQGAAVATQPDATGSHTRHEGPPARSHCVAKLYRRPPTLWLTLNSSACAAAGLSTEKKRS